MTDIQLLDDNAIELVVDGNAQVITSVEWGEITGTLSNQTDLQNELNAKADVSSVEALSSQVSEMEGDIGDIETSLNNKVDKEVGKGLSTNDFTNAYKDQVDTNKESIDDINEELENKVDKIQGKGLSTNDFTNAYKDKIDTNAEDIDDLEEGKVDKVAGKGLSTNDYDNTAKDIVDNVTANLGNKVDKVSGKGLSTNDFTNADKTKLDGIESGAEVNVIEDIKVDNVSLTPTNKSVNIDLSGKENVSNKTTTLSSDSTDTQYPSAKCVYDKVSPLETTINDLSQNVVKLDGNQAIGGEKRFVHLGATSNLYNYVPNGQSFDVYILELPQEVGTLATQEYVDSIVGDIETLLEAI